MDSSFGFACYKVLGVQDVGPNGGATDCAAALGWALWVMGWGLSQLWLGGSWQGVPMPEPSCGAYGILGVSVGHMGFLRSPWVAQRLWGLCGAHGIPGVCVGCMRSLGSPCA